MHSTAAVPRPPEVGAADRTDHADRRAWPDVRVGAVLGGAVVGAATAYGQYWLPESIGSLVNSSGAWCAAAFALALPSVRPRTAMAAGALALAAMLAGYVVAAGVRGYASSSSLLVFWGVAALLAGPLVGAAAFHVRHGSPHRAATGAGVIGGLLVGEGAYGLLVVAETTSPAYWWGQIAVGAAVVALVVRRHHRRGVAAVAFGTTAVVATAFTWVYAMDLMAVLS